MGLLVQRNRAIAASKSRLRFRRAGDPFLFPIVARFYVNRPMTAAAQESAVFARVSCPLMESGGGSYESYRATHKYFLLRDHRQPNRSLPRHLNA